MADEGVPIHVLRKIAGHGSLVTAQRSLHPDAQSASSPQGLHGFCNSLTYASHLLLSLRVARCRWVSIAQGWRELRPWGVSMPAFALSTGAFCRFRLYPRGIIAADRSGRERLPPRRKLAPTFCDMYVYAPTCAGGRFRAVPEGRARGLKVEGGHVGRERLVRDGRRSG